MLNRINTSLRKYINLSNERSANVVKNVIASFGVRGVSILIGLILVPLTLNYIGKAQNGIWLTITSLVGWITFFDIGFGNGLRNRFTEAKAVGDYVKARAYVSTTYVSLGIVFILVWVLCLCTNFFLDWSSILKAPANMANELSLVVFIVFTSFCIRFVLMTINTVLVADQKPAKPAFFDMLGQLLILICIFILAKTTSGSLLYLAIVLGTVPVLILLCSSFWYYNHEYKIFRPSVRLFQKKLVKDILNLGLKFFVAQVAALVMLQSANIIITRLFGSESVTEYDLACRYFGFPLSFLMIIIVPLWSAYTDAYARKDHVWMQRTLKKIYKLFAFFVFVAVVMLTVSPTAIYLWSGKKVQIPFSLSVSVCIYFILYMWVSIHIFILNGIGKIKLQFLFSIFEAALYIPLAILFGKAIGVPGIACAMIFFAAIRSVWAPIQLHKLLFNKATGIWER